MAGPADWGAVPLENPSPESAPSGPAAWGAVPLTEKPLFGTPEYVTQMAKKHGVDEDTVRSAAHSQYTGHGLSGVASTVGLGSLVPKAGAAISAAAAPLTGKGVQAPTFGERYGKESALQEELARDYEHDHPILSTASELGGAGLTGMGLVRAGAGPLIGVVGGGLAKQIGAGVAAGAGYSALDAKLRGEDTLPAAGVGAAVGAGGPAIGRLAGEVVPAVRNMLRGGRPPSTPQNTFRVGTTDVPIDSAAASGLNTAGQTGGSDLRDLSAIQDLQDARRGAQGAAAQRATASFDRLTDAGVEQAKDELRTMLDPNPSYAGQVRANDPYEAGTMARDAIQEAEQRQRQNYDQLYQRAAQIPGDIHAPFFNGITQRIQQDLSNRARPVIIDGRTTPIAAAMLEDIDRNIAQLRVPNMASPHGQPDPNTILGISMQGVEQMRKRLVSIGGSAGYANPGDLRAVSAVKDAFDQQIEDAIRQRLFTGQSDDALNAFRAARQAYSTHASLFTKQANDQGIGRMIQDITGRNGGAGSSPTEIANMLYGTSKIGASPKSRMLAERIREIVGENSPAWTAIKQGLFSRLVESPEGIADRGPKVIADRIFDFLNGSGASLSQTMFSPRERAMMQQYAQLMRQLQIPQAGANWSGTASGIRRLATHSLRTLMAVMGEHLMGPLGVVGGLSAHAAAGAIQERGAAGGVVRSLYMTPQQQQAERRLGEQLGRYGSTISQAIRTGVHPAAAIHGRQASDGNHYLPDPTRPGKYLRIDDRRDAGAA